MKIIEFLFNSRFLFLMIFLACAFSLAGAFYIEYFGHELPCVLCWVQRAMFFFTGIFCILAVIHNPKGFGRRIYAFLAVIFSSLGIVAACRQVWLKYNPGISCIPDDIESIFAKNSFFEAIFKAFQGTPDCGLVEASFFGIELPVWGIILFTGFTLVLLFQIVRPNPKSFTIR